LLRKVIVTCIRSSPVLLLLILASGLFELLFHYLSALSYQYLIDKALLPKDASVLALIIGALLAIGLLSVLANIAGDYAEAKLGSKLAYDYRMKLYRHTQMQSHRFYERFRLGDLLSRHTEDIPGVHAAVIETLTNGFVSTLSVVIGLTILFTMEWRLTLIAIVGSALVFIPYRLLKARSLRLNEAYLAQLGQFTSDIDESVKLHKVIRAFDLRSAMRVRIENRLQTMLTIGVRRSFIHASLSRMPLLAVAVLAAIILGYGGYLAFHDRLSIGTFIAFNSIFVTVGQSLFGVTRLLPRILSARTNLQRLQEVLDWQPDVIEQGTRELPIVRDRITLRQTTFSYGPSSQPALQELNLVIPAVGFTSIVGASGSGKSTLLQLLLRFEDPTSGSVLYDGVDIRDCTYSSLLRHIGVVFQDSVLFGGTIRDNIRIGKPDASERDIVEAATAAGIHETIAGFPDGYDTLVHNQGESLSGGQRQRMALARALIRKPALLFLDEATSALDPETERAVNETILTLSRSCAVVSVTHRLSYAAGSDRIIVLDRGKAAESGTHDELMASHGPYRRMWDKQHGFAITKGGSAQVDGQRVGRLPFFEGLDSAELQQISRMFMTERFVPGTRIVEQDDPGDKFYILVRGKVEVIVRDPKSGERRKVAALEDGDHFGEIALLHDVPRTATVEAVTACVCLALSGEAFQPFITRHPAIRDRLERTIRMRNERRSQA